jgi:GTPase SAR1 family protein
MRVLTDCRSGRHCHGGCHCDWFELRVGFAHSNIHGHQIWDFAGQDIYYAVHQLFLSPNALYLVVWDIRRRPEEARVSFWLNSIQTRAPNAAVVLVGTHVDAIGDIKTRKYQVCCCRQQIDRRQLQYTY